MEQLTDQFIQKKEATMVRRRQLLKIIATTGGTLALSNSLPDKWAKPIVEVGVLPAHAQMSTSLTPISEIVDTICPDETLAATVTTFIPTVPSKADILFAFDTTGSMGGVLNHTKNKAQKILDELSALITDVQFGVVDFRDYGGSDYPYQVDQAITNNQTLIKNAINSLSVGGGGDGPESYTRVLFESYSDNSLGFRSDARKFVIMFGDNVPHDDNLNEGVPSPPINPDGVYCGGVCFLDRGRDGVLGTADDLDLQPVLDQMKINQTTLLYVHRIDDAFLVYWNHWAGLTGAGGQAVALPGATDLVTIIVGLIGEASRKIGLLTLDAAPNTFASWLTSVDSQTNLTIPIGGLTVSLGLTLSPPASTSAGVYNFTVRTVGDSAVYKETSMKITVPTAC